MDLRAATTPEDARKRLLLSNFDDDEPSAFTRMYGGKRRDDPEDDDDCEATAVDALYDGRVPAKGVTSRELIAVNAPLQSREDRRSKKVTQLVIDQFAVVANPRYDPDPPDRSRGHIFVWDFTRAMNAEVPHFFGIRELSLSQTCNWIRQEGPGKGWFRTSLDRACEALEAGAPVLIMPRDVKIALVGVARPGDLSRDGKPLVSAAAKQRGKQLTVMEAFGVSLVDYFIHG